MAANPLLLFYVSILRLTQIDGMLHSNGPLLYIVWELCKMRKSAIRCKCMLMLGMLHSQPSQCELILLIWCRNITRQRLRDVRHQGRIARSHQVQRPCLHDLAQPLTSSPSHPVSESSEHAIKILSGHTPDDALRGLGMLTAVGRFSDKLILFAKDVSRDAWLRKRAKRTWLARYALYY